MTPHKLLCIKLGIADEHPGNDLVAAGREVHMATSLKLAGRLIEQHDFGAGIVLFDACNDEACIEIEDFLLLRRGLMEWTAVMDSKCLTSETCAKLVLIAFMTISYCQSSQASFPWPWRMPKEKSN
ncbi:MAG: hypothetical protein ACR2FI_01210 [Burkholderiales bacterium]|nr:hypothetical protein [Burkholderiales bacterium]MDQ3195498.1 hypothetical protein [Pseudomonadota bacterium]